MQQVEAAENAEIRTTGKAGRPGELENLAELAHDARNMVTALALYCHLLEEPGVLTSSHRHYAGELRLVTAACNRLVEKLVLLDNRARTASAPAVESESRKRAAERMPDEPIEHLDQELLANRNLLDAMAGPAVTVSVAIQGGGRPVHLTGEDLTRVLVNMVKNSAEAISGTGTIHIGLSENADGMLLAVEDSGAGIAAGAEEKIFAPGFSTRFPAATESMEGDSSWPTVHRGLGLSITRTIIEAAGGRIRAGKGVLGGARFEIELPVRSR